MLLKSNTKNLNKLKSKLNSDNVLAKLEERYCYSKDAYTTSEQFKNPDLVVFVETIEDVQKIVKFANQHEIPIIARGAGTNMVGACTCVSGGIVLNFSKMNKILDINTTNLTVTVEPGVVLGDLKTAVDKFGLFFPPDPSNYKVSTVGGGIAQSSGGANSFKYGTFKDYILSLKIITADGKLLTLGANTSKDSVGYHLNQLIVGSEGTLGIVVEATLKLIPKPETRQIVVAYFSSIEDSVLAVNKIIEKNIFPSAIDFMDKNSIKTVEDFTHCGLLTEYASLLLIEIDGSANSMQSQISDICEALNSSNVAHIVVANNDDTVSKIWQARRASFAATARLAPNVISDDIIVPRDKISEMVNICNKIIDKYNLKMCMVGHIGDGNLHPQIALDVDNEIEYRNYRQAKAEIYENVIKLGGTISAEHGIGISKLKYAKDLIDKNSLELMKLIKKTFDPKNILNPGKIFEL